MNDRPWFAIAERNLEHLQKTQSSKEVETRRLLSEPILAAIGYDPWDVEAENRIEAEMNIESAGQAGGKGRADYVLYAAKVPYIALEIKAAGIILTDSDARQVCDYCNYSHPNIRWEVLTNGEDWRLFNNSKQGPIEQRRIFDWSLKREHWKMIYLSGPSIRGILRS
ncbi:MAG TPA: type I restriction enzyme HsdR N-terminal domain-containing protein [bacterium]|nr:type I restriction enzyme HsdR N-terminal domain-containing protein [bacterium]HQL62437.1 type I restriction enzyme HsdR N-terminal domain-containing protein [bacterium]